MPEVAGIGSFITRVAVSTSQKGVTFGLGLRWKTYGFASPFAGQTAITLGSAAPPAGVYKGFGSTQLVYKGLGLTHKYI